jgi:hypothetical protein
LQIEEGERRNTRSPLHRMEVAAPGRKWGTGESMPGGASFPPDASERTSDSLSPLHLMMFAVPPMMSYPVWHGTATSNRSSSVRCRAVGIRDASGAPRH